MSKKPSKTKPNYKIKEPKLFPEAQTPKTDIFTEATPWFSHRFICQDAFCIKRCSYEQIKSLVDKLRVLCSLEWKIIASSPRETHGYEMIPTKQIKGSLPAKFKDLKEIMVFRFGGGRIAGTRKGNQFYILFVDHNYKLYDHG